MATHSSILAWRIPGTGEPGGLPSMGSHRVGHDWSDLAAVATGLFFFFYQNSIEVKILVLEVIFKNSNQSPSHFIFHEVRTFGIK